MTGIFQKTIYFPLGMQNMSMEFLATSILTLFYMRGVQPTHPVR